MAPNDAPVQRICCRPKPAPPCIKSGPTAPSHAPDSLICDTFTANRDPFGRRAAAAPLPRACAAAAHSSFPTWPPRRHFVSCCGVETARGGRQRPVMARFVVLGIALLVASAAGFARAEDTDEVVVRRLSPRDRPPRRRAAGCADVRTPSRLTSGRHLDFYPVILHLTVLCCRDIALRVPHALRVHRSFDLFFPGFLPWMG